MARLTAALLTAAALLAGPAVATAHAGHDWTRTSQAAGVAWK